VGYYAVQLAKCYGARVSGVCGAANAELVASVGAERVYDYAKPGFSEELGRYDAVFIAIDRFPFAESLRCLRPDGTYLNVTAPVKSPAMVVASLSGGK
jgi:NADPH:quinone reductase-like Zn-dependent oxidoreductase